MRTNTLFDYTPPHLNKKSEIRNETLDCPRSEIRKQEILRPSPADGCFLLSMVPSYSRTLENNPNRKDKKTDLGFQKAKMDLDYDDVCNFMFTGT